MNFMSNAVKFTEKGTVLLSVTTHSVSGSNAVMEFSVRDSGIGIDEQQQKKIFEPFAQEDDSTTRQFGGTGLGLAISTQLVELMGGKIQLESEKGQGSRFFFQLSPSVVQLDFDAKHAAANSQIWLVCEDAAMESTLRDELNFYRIAVHQSVTSLDASQLGLTTKNTSSSSTPKRDQMLRWKAKMPSTDWRLKMYAFA